MGFKRYLILCLILSHACNKYPVDCGNCCETALCCKSPLCILAQLITWSHLCFSDIALCVQGLSIGCDLPPPHWWCGCNMGLLVWQWSWMCRKKRTHPEMKSLTRDYGLLAPALNASLNFHLWEGYAFKGWLKLNQRWVYVILVWVGSQAYRFVEFFSGQGNLTWCLHDSGFPGIRFDRDLGGRWNNIYEPAGFARLVFILARYFLYTPWNLYYS